MCARLVALLFTLTARPKCLKCLVARRMLAEGQGLQVLYSLQVPARLESERVSTAVDRKPPADVYSFHATSASRYVAPRARPGLISSILPDASSTRSARPSLSVVGLTVVTKGNANLSQQSSDHRFLAERAIRRLGEHSTVSL